MYNEYQAKKLVEGAYPGAKAVDCFPYKGLILVRVEHPDPDEGQYDPFLSVDVNSGAVAEFSVLNDPTGVAEAYQKRKGLT